MSDRRPAPAEGGKSDAFIHERASATPVTTPGRVRAKSGKAAKTAAPSSRAKVRGPVTAAPLQAIEEWFAAVIMHDGTPQKGVAGAVHGADFGVLGARDLERVVTAGPRLSALERMAIYHHGYRARLVEVLTDDYPCVRHAIGERAFHDLCTRYVEEHPSRSPNLNGFGRHMAAFCRTQPGRHRDFAADLAKVEWAMVEAIHAPDAAVLSLEQLASVAPETWGDARLPKSDSLQLLRFDYPANRYLQGFLDEKGPKIPAREATATAVYRKEKTIWRMDLTPAMTGLLEALFSGSTLGEALNVLSPGEGEGEAAAEALAEAERNVMVWFRAWVAGGFFARVDFAASD